MRQNVNIVCVCVGNKYGKDHVNRLYRMVERNCSLPFSFYCISDKQQDCNTIFIKKELDLESYWWKIELFNLDFKDPTLYFDLDVVIHNNIDSFFDKIKDKVLTIKGSDIGEFYPYDGRFTILDIPPAVINTSIMGYIPIKTKYIYKKFLTNIDYNIIKYYGLDRFVYEHCKDLDFLNYDEDYYHRSKGYSGQLVNNLNFNPDSKVCILSQCTEKHYEGLEEYFL